MPASKAERYIGLCMKAGRLTCGFNAVETEKKRVYLLLLCASATENAVKSALKLKKKCGCELAVLTGRSLGEIVGRENCKLAAVRDENLAKAILSAADENLKIYPGGNV